MEYIYNPPQSVTGYTPGSNDNQLRSFDPYQNQDPGYITFFTGDKGSLSDKQAFYLNEMSKYQEQAFQVGLMNYQNQYNSPFEQMLRYQAAGLSPWLSYSQNQTPAAGISGNPSARAQSHGSSSSAQQMSSAASFISSAVGVARAAREMYDYMKYGKDISAWSALSSGSKAHREDLETQFQRWFSRDSGIIPGSDQSLSDIYGNSMRARYNEARTLTQEEKVNQLRAVVNMIPDQQARTQALKALDDYRLEIMKGQNDAILNLNTGNVTADSFIQLLAYWLFKQNL